MSPAERDDVMLHILTLRQEDEDQELSKVWIEELDKRKAAYESGLMSGRPFDDVLSEWK